MGRRRRIRRSCSLPQLLLPLKISLEEEADVGGRGSWGERRKSVMFNKSGSNTNIQEGGTNQQIDKPNTTPTITATPTTTITTIPTTTTNNNLNLNKKKWRQSMSSPVALIKDTTPPHSLSPLPVKPLRSPSPNPIPLSSSSPTASSSSSPSNDEFFTEQGKLTPFVNDDVSISVNLVPYLDNDDDLISLNPEDYDLLFMVQVKKGIG